MSWIELAAQRRPQQVPQGVKPPENASDWYRIENSADEPDATDIFVYDSIGGWFGMYADDFIRDLKEVTTKRINLRVNSPGGSVFEGIAIANALRSHPASVTVYVDALAASIASVIALAGDKLIMMPQSQLMIHDASGACYGNAADMEYMVGLLNKQSDNIADAYADRAGGTSAEWRDLMRAETWYSAKEAVSAGLADEVMPFLPKKEEEEECAAPASARMAASWDLSMYRYAGREKAPTPPVPYAKGGIVASGASPAPVMVDLSFTPKQTAALVDMMRAAIRAEIAIVEAAVSPAHSTAVKDGTWDAGSNEGRLPSPVPVATAKKMYTYYDADKVVDGAVPKSACKLPHHFVSDDGSPGAASVSGVRNALARLPQTQGLSDAERTAAEAHLRKHLNAFSGGEDEAADDVVEDLAASPSPALTPTPAEEPEDAGDDEPEDASDEDDVEDAKKKKLPPWLKPDEDEEDDDEDEKKSKDSVDDDPPSASTADPAEPADSWSQVIAGLIKSPSPSADDVLTRLKEGSS